jgi:putative Mn2+ efflux pump MntP
MIYEAQKNSKIKEKNVCSAVDCSSMKTLFLLAVATSIDSFAVGLSFALLQISIIGPVLIIGGITACVTFAGYYLGRSVGHFFENKIEVVGGVILIGIGIKILLEHLV